MASVLNIGVSALQAYQRAMDTTGHNIANVNTPSYSRQRAEMITREPEYNRAGWMGSGVKVAKIQRQYDDMLAAQIRSAQSTTSELSSYYERASQFDNLLANPDVGLSPALQDYFDALQGLADDPSDVPTRQLALTQSQILVDRFRYLNGQFEQARGRTNNELSEMVGEVSRLASNIAAINQKIFELSNTAAGEPNDLMDQREQMLNELSEYVNVTTLEGADGTMSVFIGKGQALVLGNTHGTFSLVTNVADAGRQEIALTNSTGTEVISDQIAGGEIGGLLEFRREVLDAGQNQLGLVALGLADDVNAQHQLGMDLQGNIGGAYFNNLNAVPATANTANGGDYQLGITVTDPSKLQSSDYRLRYDSGTYTLTRLTDNQVVATSASLPINVATTDGFNISLGSGTTIASGDAFLIRPTRDAAGLLQLAVGNVNELAAAAPWRAREALNGSGLPSNSGNGAIGQPVVTAATGLAIGDGGAVNTSVSLTFDAGNNRFNVADGSGALGTINYNPATDSGATMDLSGLGIAMNFKLTGTPSNGDQFFVEVNAGGLGDNRNALAIANLQSSRNLLAGSASYQEAYGQFVADIGSRTRQAQLNSAAQQGLLEYSQAALQSQSGVNLDEEAANLIKYQQYYQAAAQLIAVASTTFDTLIGAMRR